MTLKQAERRAYKLWGKRWATAVQEWAVPGCRYAVGYTFAGMFMPMGQGATWEDAFKAAAERNKRIGEATP